jgi:hypothetical protein
MTKIEPFIRAYNTIPEAGKTANENEEQLGFQAEGHWWFEWSGYMSKKHQAGVRGIPA